MDPIVKLAASALPNEKKYVLFAGAGVSKDAGVPSAWDIMLKTASLLYAAEPDIDENVDLEKWFIESDYSKMQYSELIESFYSTPAEQQSFLDKYLDGHEIGDIHKSIAELVRLGIIRCIVTTNFDHYIEKALAEKGIKYQIIVTDDELKYSEPLIQCKSLRIYKPNGTLGKGFLKNTPKDLEKYSEDMENELSRLFNEHGLIVLGYSGRDPNMQKVFEKANFNYYPLFWVDPNPAFEEMEKILQTKANYHYIQCGGANQFITDFFGILERLKNISPNLMEGPSVMELRKAFKSSDMSKVPLYQEFLDGTLINLNNGKIEKSEFEEYDDVIFEQIKNGKIISYNFIEASLLACKYGDKESIETIYNFFGNLMNLYYVENREAYYYLVYEFFVSFVACLIKYNHWNLIGDILSQKIFVEESRTDKYLEFKKINRYIRVLNETRDKRLSLNRLSVVADIICDRFMNTELSDLISHKEFIEADYYLFIRSLCESEDVTDIWYPRSCFYVDDRAPSYIEKAARKDVLESVSRSIGIEDSEIFVERLKDRHMKFNDYFHYDVDDPLEFFDFNILGSIE